MIHCPEPSAVTGQFPNSIEVQLLGPKNANEDRIPSATWPVGRTGNMCIAGDAFVVSYNGNNNYTNHCTTVSYPDAWKGTQIPWDKEYSDITVRVLGDSLVQHIIRGQKVFESSKIRYKSNGNPVKEGYIAIQAEGTATMFRKLEVLSLIGCMDKASPNYRSYFVKHDAGLCTGTAVRPRDEAGPEFAWRMRGSDLRWEHAGITGVSLFHADGSLAGKAERAAEGGWRLAMEPGRYWARIETAQGAFRQSVNVLP